MSDPSSDGTEIPGSPKKKVSPARNAASLVVLVVLIVVGVIQYSAVLGYNAAVKAVDTRSQDEDKGLLQVTEVEGLIGKSPDGPGIDFNDGNRTFTKTTYTWRGALKSYTLTAFYTKGPAPCLHHFETEGAKYAPEPAPTQTATIAIPVPRKGKGAMKKAGPAAEPEKTAAAPLVTNANEPASSRAAEPSKPAAPGPADAKGPK